MLELEDIVGASMIICMMAGRENVISFFDLTRCNNDESLEKSQYFQTFRLIINSTGVLIPRVLNRKTTIQFENTMLGVMSINAIGQLLKAFF